MMVAVSRRRALGAALAGLTALAAGPAAAEPAPLEELPVDKLSAMEPILRHGDVALLEAKPNGQMKQVTVIALVQAPADVLREVLTTPERWAEFVPGISRVQVERQPDGSKVFAFQMDLKVLHLEARNRLATLPNGEIEMRDPNPTDRTNIRVQLLPVPGGTVMVEYGYTEVLNANKWIQRVVRAAPMLEHGLALATELAHVRAMKLRAERLAPPGSFPHALAGSKGPGFGFLLTRGRVAVIRSLANGRLADISILDVIHAPAARVEQVILNPGEYRQFMDGVRSSREAKRQGEATLFDMQFDISILGFQSRYALRKLSPGTIDVVAVDGDLRGAHMRWDLTARGPNETLAVYRANQDLGAASPLVLGTVYRTMPLFEHGVAVAAGLVQTVGVRGRAEGWR